MKESVSLSASEKLFGPTNQKLICSLFRKYILKIFKILNSHTRIKDLWLDLFEPFNAPDLYELSPYASSDLLPSEHCGKKPAVKPPYMLFLPEGGTRGSGVMMMMTTMMATMMMMTMMTTTTVMEFG